MELARSEAVVHAREARVIASLDWTIAAAGAEPSLPRRGLLRGWMVANAIGLVVGGALFVVVAVVAVMTGLDQDDGGRQPVFGAVLGGTVGGALAVGQAYALRGRIRRPRAWALATAVGLTAGSTVVFGALDNGSGIPDELQRALHPLALALATGPLQARVLRGEIQRAWRWVLVAAVAWGLGSALALGVPITGRRRAAMVVAAMAVQGVALALLAPVDDPHSTDFA